MRALILGGNGFIGSHLVDDLLSKNYLGSILDVSRDPFREEIKGVKYFFGRLEEKELITRALADVDIVFHLVSTTVPSNSNANIVYDIESNLVSTINLLNEMVQQGVQRIVYLSSGGAVYGQSKVYPIAENHPLAPISSYGIVKVAIEKYLFLFGHLHGLKSLILRPSNVYGPRQRFTKKQGVVAHFLYNFFTKKPLSIWGDGSIRKDYIYVKDLVEVMIKGMETNLEGTYNVGSGGDTSISEIVEIIEKVTKEEMSVNYEEAKSFDVEKVRLDINKIKNEIDWYPELDMSDGIKEQYFWMKEVLSQ